MSVALDILHDAALAPAHSNAVKIAALIAVPPSVITAILPVGTVAVICASGSSVKLVALTPPKVPLVAPVKLWPVITREFSSRDNVPNDWKNGCDSG